MGYHKISEIHDCVFGGFGLSYYEPTHLDGYKHFVQNKPISELVSYEKFTDRFTKEISKYKLLSSLDNSKVKSFNASNNVIEVTMSNFKYRLNLNTNELILEVDDNNLNINVGDNIEYLNLLNLSLLIESLNNTLKKKKVIKNQTYSKCIRETIKSINNLIKNKYKIQYKQKLIRFTKRVLCKINSEIKSTEYNHEMFTRYINNRLVKHYGDNYSDINVKFFEKIVNKEMISYFKQEINKNSFNNLREKITIMCMRNFLLDLKHNRANQSLNDVVNNYRFELKLENINDHQDREFKSIIKFLSKNRELL